MSRKHNVLPNVMPDGTLEPINNMDLIVAKLKHDGKANAKYVDRIVIGNKK